MKVGFVILNYNSWSMTKALAEKLSAYSCVDEIVVVDNVSTDDSFAHLSEIACHKIHVHQSDRNGGYSYGNNYGAQICKDLGVQLLFISNPDVDIEEAELQKIIAQFRQTDYTLLSAVEYDIDDKQSADPVWKMPTYKDDLLACFFIGRKILSRQKQPALDTGVPVQEADMLKGSFMGVRLDAFLDAGGFDDEFFLFCEERVLANKIRSNGGRIGLVTGAKYNHNHTASIVKIYKKVHSQMALLYRSRKLYHKKYSKVGAVKYLLFRCATAFSLLEFRVLSILKRS